MGKDTSLKRILVISYSFPPQKSPRAAQLFKLFRHLRTLPNFVFDVVTINPELSPEKADQDLVLPSKNIHLHYALGLEINYYLNYFIQKFFDEILDGKIIWRFFASRLALKLLKRNRYDAIIAFSQPFSSAVVGLGLKEKEPQIPLISYFSDPWTENPYFSGLPKNKRIKNEQAERKAMGLSDKIIFCSQEILDNYLKKYGEAIKRKAFFIPHTYDLDLYPKAQESSPKKDKIKIVHTGNLYAQRSPKNFLLALKKLQAEKRIDLQDIEIYFYGTVVQEIKRDLIGQDLLGLAIWERPVPYLQSLKAISKADILLSLDAAFKKSPFLPSKLIDYFGAKKPILALSPEKGAVARLIPELRSQGFPYFLADISSIEDIASKVEDIVSNLRTLKKLRPEPPAQFNLNEVREKWQSILINL